MGHQHTFKTRGSYQNIRQICEFVLQGAQAADLDEATLFHVELACDEACTNIIEHAYGGEDVGDIEVAWWVSGPDFVITFYDNGRLFNPADVSPPNLDDFATLDNPEKLRVGGLGIHFMRTLMDDVEYSFDPDKGNTLTLRKKLHDE